MASSFSYALVLPCLALPVGSFWASSASGVSEKGTEERAILSLGWQFSDESWRGRV